jgi:hypothetical protein
VKLDLAPYESRAFVFSGTNQDPLNTAPASTRQVADLSSDWKVTFTGVGKTESEGALTDWTADSATLHYSGEAVYARDFSVGSNQGQAVYLEVDGGEALPMPRKPGDPPVLMPNGLPDPRVTRTGPGMHAYYEPPVREGAIVFVNGQEMGALWHPPYRLDVSKALKAGTNHIEIHVYNTALNAWSAEPPHDYGPLKAKYGDRFQMQDLDQVKPVPSGLVGTIRLVEMEPGK